MEAIFLHTSALSLVNNAQFKVLPMTKLQSKSLQKTLEILTLENSHNMGLTPNCKKSHTLEEEEPFTLDLIGTGYGRLIWKNGSSFSRQAMV